MGYDIESLNEYASRYNARLAVAVQGFESFVCRQDEVEMYIMFCIISEMNSEYIFI